MTIDIPQYEHWLSFRANGIMSYSTSLRHRNSLKSSAAFMANSKLLAKRERYIGQVTSSMVKRMKKAITLLCQSTPYQWVLNPISGNQVHHHLSFITLTITESAEVRCAKWAHKNLLEPMLRILRNRYGMKSYIWKCELQQNGTVHYHITSDLFIQHDSLRMEWNKICKSKRLLDVFEKTYGHVNPNSTDIHSVKKVNNMESYLVKYITKEVASGRVLCAKVWDCSTNLKKSDYFKCHLDAQTHEYLRELQASLQVSTHYFERAVFLHFGNTDYYSGLRHDIISSYHSHLISIRTWQKPKKQATVQSALPSTSFLETSKMSFQQSRLNFSSA